MTTPKPIEGTVFYLGGDEPEAPPAGQLWAQIAVPIPEGRGLPLYGKVQITPGNPPAKPTAEPVGWAEVYADGSARCYPDRPSAERAAAEDLGSVPSPRRVAPVYLHPPEAEADVFDAGDIERLASWGAAMLGSPLTRSWTPEDFALLGRVERAVDAKATDVDPENTECGSISDQKYLDALAEIEAWKDATGLVDGHGDPDGITPDIARKHWEGVERERDRLRAMECRSVALTAVESLIEDLASEIPPDAGPWQNGAWSVIRRVRKALQATEHQSVSLLVGQAQGVRRRFLADVDRVRRGEAEMETHECGWLLQVAAEIEEQLIAMGVDVGDAKATEHQSKDPEPPDPALAIDAIRRVEESRAIECKSIDEGDSYDSEILRRIEGMFGTIGEDLIDEIERLRNTECRSMDPAIADEIASHLEQNMRGAEALLGGDRRAPMRHRWLDALRGTTDCGSVDDGGEG